MSRLLKAPKLPEPKVGIIRVGDQVVRREAGDRMIVVGGTRGTGFHCQSIDSGHLGTWMHHDLEQVTEDGHVLTHRDLV